ncbi:MAG TPA: tetratricopeptide repeat protein [Pyrinomonadaceae bacterium]|nr:tetratricopeptide repeat protein [Pyrinomonadaceae bacterium]
MNMSPEPHDSVEVFYSYAHEDEKLRDELKKHLSNLKRQGVITDWYDRDISAGKEWNEEIEKHLNSAKVILLLISPDFMNSDYINAVEVKRAMERHEAGEARVIPVVLRPVDWQGAPFRKLHSLPSDIRPVTLWPNQDQAFLDVTKGIRRALDELFAPSVGTPASLDIPNPPKVGFISRRDRENQDFIERVSQELRPGKNHLVVLWGAGGVGKTAIAAETVRGLIETFAGRIAWVSADGLESFSLSTLLDGIATQLGDSDLRKLPLELKNEQVRDLVKSTPTLVVLDNFETIDLSEQAHCIDWLGKPAPCTALITTRDKIEEAHDIPIEVMSAKEASNLLDRLMAQTHEVGAFANLDRARLIQTAEANPLVLQWIVGQIDLAQDPDEVLDDLQQGEGKAVERVFNRSYNLKQLDKGGRAVLLALSLFAPSASRKAVAEVANFGKESDKKKFRNAVKSLSALWLIHTTDESKRLAIEGLTRQLTKARLDSDPRGKSFRPRFVSRFLRFAESHRKPTGEDYNELEAEKDNLLTATDLAFLLGDGISVIQLAYAMALPSTGMLSVRGYWDEALAVSKLALTMARRSGSEHQIASWLNNVAGSYYRRGDIRAARELADESLALQRNLGNKLILGQILHNLAIIAHSLGQFDEARRLCQESNAESRNNQGETASTIHLLGFIAYDKGEFKDARRLYEEGLEIGRRFGDENAISSCLYGLALLARDQGEPAAASQFSKDCLEIKQRLGDQIGIAYCLHTQSLLAFDQGNFPEALRLCNDSLNIAQKLGDQSVIANDLHQLGVLQIAGSDYQRAEKSLQRSLESLKRLENPVGYAECLETTGHLKTAQDQLAAAEALYTEALEIAESLGLQFRKASVKHSLAKLADRQGDKAKATALLQASLATFEKLRSPKAENVRRDLERLSGRPS